MIHSKDIVSASKDDLWKLSDEDRSILNDKYKKMREAIDDVRKDDDTTDDCCYDPLETMEWGDRYMTCEQYKQKGGSTGNSIPAQMEVVCHRVRDIESLLVMDTTGGWDPYFDDKTNVVTLFKKEIASLKDEIKLIKSDGYHWNVLTRKLVESEERNIRRMESTEGDVRNIMSILHGMDDDLRRIADVPVEE